MLSRSALNFHTLPSFKLAQRHRGTKLYGRRNLFGSRSLPPPSPLRRAATATTIIIAGTFLTVYYLDPRSSLHRYIITPIVRNAFDAESGHKIAVRVLKSGLGPKDKSDDLDVLKTTLWGKEMSNPIGLAAGFDKNGEAIDGLLDLGFGWVEIGSVTPVPQAGNPIPRVFHLLSDDSLINRYGFPSLGSVAVLANLRERKYHSSNPNTSSASLRPGRFLAINLGKNKSSPVESPEDFLKGIRSFGPWADALVINISSPNTPGLRSLQASDLLRDLIAAAISERERLPSGPGAVPKLLVKLAPDLTPEQLKDIASVITGTPGIDGVIVSNTTIQRPAGLVSENKHEQGGLSGPPLMPLSLKMVRDLRTQLPASIPIIGCGGISSGADAIEFAKAGASCVQLYTAFGYGGPGTPRRIKDEVVEELQKLGMTWSQLTEDAISRLAPKVETQKIAQAEVAPSQIEVTPPPPQSVKTADSELDIQSLIKEAERIKDLLDKLESSS